jgi:hypothetical protein
VPTRPLVDLLTEEHSLADFNPLSASTFLSKRLSPRLKKVNVLKALFAALEETPPPSLNEIAETLGYKSTHPLRKIDTRLCDQIVANFNQHGRRMVKTTFAPRIQDDEVIISALKSALRENSPPSVEEISRRLGYKTAQAIRHRFPLLCKALVEKKRDLESHRREQIEIQLEQALHSNPPISLDVIAKNPNYRSRATLSTKYPEMCRKIRDRYAKYSQTQFMLRVKHDVESILLESPPPPIKAAAKRIGVSDNFLKKHFSKECRAISVRYMEHRKNQTEKNKENARSKIQGIVQDLIKRGVFPSMTAVVNVYTTGYLRRDEVWSTVLQAREDLGFRV